MQLYLMLPYHELVKKAREMHKTMGERKFREAFEKNPTALVDVLGYHRKHHGGSRIGTHLLQAFEFYPLTPVAKSVHDTILRDYRDRPLHVGSGRFGEIVPVLEARGVVRTSEVVQGKRRTIFVSHVLDKGVWRPAMLPTRKTKG